MRLKFLFAAIFCIIVFLTGCSGNKGSSEQFPTPPPAVPDKVTEQTAPAIEPQDKKSAVKNKAEEQQVSPPAGKGPLVSPEKGGSLPPAPAEMAFKVGQKIPSFSLADLGGNNHTQQIFSVERLTVLNFWATF